MRLNGFNRMLDGRATIRHCQASVDTLSNGLVCGNWSILYRNFFSIDALLEMRRFKNIKTAEETNKGS